MALVLALTLLSGGVLSCTSVDGTDPYALWETFGHSGGLFHFHCPNPPWKKIAGFDRDRPVLVLEPHDNEIEGPDPHAKMRMEATAESDTSVSAAFQSGAAHWTGLGYEVGSPVVWENGVGDEGILLEAEGDDFWVIQVYFAGEERIVSLAVWGSGDSTDDDLWLVFEGFEPRRSGAN